MKNAITIIALVCAFRVCAASVVWSGGSVSYYAPGENWGYGPGVQIYDWGLNANDRIYIDVFMDVQLVGNAAGFTFLSKSDTDRFLRMSPGETIGSSTMTGAGMIEETMHVDLYSTVFIAYETVAYKDIHTQYNVYGWVEFGYDDSNGLIAVSGALDLDGGPMIVGGGSIPEPSSGLLLLLGAAGLALRRRRE